MAATTALVTGTIRGMDVDDASGDIVYLEGHRARRIRGGTVTTIAGDRTTPGTTGDFGPASAARFNVPSSVHFDAQGRPVISDSGNHCIRIIE